MTVPRSTVRSAIKTREADTLHDNSFVQSVLDGSIDMLIESGVLDFGRTPNTVTVSDGSMTVRSRRDKYDGPDITTVVRARNVIVHRLDARSALTDEERSNMRSIVRSLNARIRVGQANQRLSDKTVRDRDALAALATCRLSDSRKFA